MSFEQLNREYFDKMANSYNAKPWQKKMSAYLTDELRKSVDWVGADFFTTNDPKAKEVRFLDYACGTGMVSRALGPYVTTTRGIDISEKMVETFNSLASKASLPPAQIHAVVGNLLSEPPNKSISGPEFYDFDIAAIGLGFHHMQERVLMLKRIADRLKTGGVLLILDFLIGETEGKKAFDDWPEDSRKAVATAGFTEEQMKEVYEEAGFTDFRLKVFEEKIVMEHGGVEKSRICFLAKGTKR
ncbi:S-adenosyl-L-methionine-dependent methyltransferase [Rhizodiscina lignyota]|uniref:S-adenosyl-L-methionine-dependent methyltransferase n=1 Tax=Rhizodiscina lignyota TaxID=1504668 RepID=A0A9P4IF08_9PEZI|nr:S-adenosyl-L-methionine-dependent methyltransferase [Rhizodiscina lignyota]